MAFIFRLSPRDWVILIIAITIVWITELLNTALEVVIDLASPQVHPLAKIGKDVGAASVLLAALASIVIGLIILGPPFLSAVRELLRIAFLPNLEV
jgi:diacylglycerol kinase